LSSAEGKSLYRVRNARGRLIRYHTLLANATGRTRVGVLTCWPYPLPFEAGR
jgi:hypothetical protein